MKYTVVWGDHINFIVIEVSSSKRKANALKNIINSANIMPDGGCWVETLEETIEYTNNIPEHEQGHFCIPSSEILSAEEDYFYNKLVSVITIKKDSMNILPTINIQKENTKGRKDGRYQNNT